MPLDPQLAQLLAMMPPMELHTLAPQQVRKGQSLLLSQVRQMMPDFPIATVADRTIPGPAGAIPVRQYTPVGEGPFPLVVFYHGGGWVLGDLNSHDVLCRGICHHAGAVVLAVDYRLAPEHPFPAAVEDADAALQWASAHTSELGADAARLAVCGDSAGGNLAAVVAQLARDRGGPQVRFQALIYPATDFTATFPSLEANASAPILPRETIDWFKGHYIADPAQMQLATASPMLSERMSDLPPAYILTAEYDPLCDEGEAYGAKLRDAGVPVVISRYDGMVHGFLAMPMLQQVPVAIAEIGTAIRDGLR